MQILINFSLLFAKSNAEKKLTYLYVAIFAFFLILLIIDSTAGKKWITDKPLKKITWVLLFVALIAMAVLYFVL